MMARVGIPSHFQSEVTFLIAFILFSSSYFTQLNFPRMYFNDYMNAGIKARLNNRFIDARKNFEEALKIDESHPYIGQENPLLVGEVHGQIGLVYEAEGDIDNAKKHFDKSLELGDFKSLKRLARLSIYRKNFEEAETLLNLGLQKTEAKDSFGRYLTYTYLGWTYLEQKRYVKAEEALTQAIEIEKQIPQHFFDSLPSGQGIANCFQARVYELRKKPTEAAKQWKICTEVALPESLAQYKAILQMNPEIGTKLRSEGILKRDTTKN
jgi:tetratricopeptide (TPR) repeat protein